MPCDPRNLRLCGFAQKQGLAGTCRRCSRCVRERGDGIFATGGSRSRKICERLTCRGLVPAPGFFCFPAGPTKPYIRTGIVLLTQFKVDQKVNEMRTKVQDTCDNVDRLRSDQRQTEINRWLSPPDPSTNNNEALRRRHEGSGRWFLRGEAFNEWKKKRQNSFLWLHGIPGCGKTILSSIVIESLSSHQPLLYFYFDFTDPNKQTFGKMLCALISQLCYQCAAALPQLDQLFSSCKSGYEQPTSQQLREVFSRMIEQVEEIWIVLDALDESSVEGRKEVLIWMKDILVSPERRNVHLLMTSRLETDIESRIMEFPDTRYVVPIQSDSITDDISAYVHWRVKEDDSLKRWRSYPEVQNEIENVVGGQANGMFRLAACQLDALGNCLDYRKLQEALASLPTTLHKIYARILHDIPNAYRQNAIKILQFLTYSERPLRIEEAVDAIAVDTEGDRYFDPKYRMPDHKEIFYYCSSLVVAVPKEENSEAADRSTELQLAHLSVKEYLLSARYDDDDDIMENFREVEAKASMARICLAYLLDLDVELSNEVLTENFPFARYCARYWIAFAAVAESTDKSLEGFVQKFFCCDRGTYRNCYNLWRPDESSSSSVWTGDGAVSALYYTSFGGLTNAVKYLLTQGANVDTQGGCHGNALGAASYQGHDRIVELLLSRGADVNAHCGYHGSALGAASHQGHGKTVELLLSRGADVNAQGGFHRSALGAASYQGHGKIVELLLSRGADVNSYGIHGSALGTAVHRGHDKVVELLLDSGADLILQDMRKNCAELSAASHQGHYKVVELLLSRGANVNSHGAYGGVVYAAADNGHDKIVELLLRKGANPNSFGLYGSALWGASDRGYYKIVEMLLSKGASMEFHGSKPLDAALNRGHSKIVKLLLSNSADVTGLSMNDFKIRE
ncbi:hypothetical protein TWF696_006684 [Orbilia brochopaga]|uniref:NACHT domain-containing protein n=1 Tax=Orbilia brochopaga TaxID=3140254 RepID=A0AAV9UPZ8_9PEZI